MKNSPIGIIDSGLGGLTIWKEIHTLLPHESTIYLGDSLNTPYGKRSSGEIYHLTTRMVQFLLAKKVKVIIIACNTITVSCLEKLRDDFPQIQFIGTVPAIKTAVSVTRNNHIGILSTTYTAESTYQHDLINHFAAECSIVNRGTDAIVPLLESGKVVGEEIRQVLQTELRPFQEAQCDTLVLGCTHFPLVKEQIQEIMGAEICILDSGNAIARQVKRVLEENDLLATGHDASFQFFTTGNSALANTVLQATITEREDLTLGHFVTVNI